jgi:YD repeat-containing protein
MRSSTASMILAFCAMLAVQSAPLNSGSAMISRSEAFTYDAEGNEIEKRGSFEYDAEGNEIEKRSDFEYDAEGNEIEKRDPKKKKAKKAKKATSDLTLSTML